MPRFTALHHADRLHLVNPLGDTGILTLWSTHSAARRRLTEASPGILDPTTTRVAVLSNLYGDGMYAMFCNLLYNPQIRHLIAVGQELGQPTCQEITAFLEHGLEEAVVLGRRLKRIPGHSRCFPDTPEFDAEQLQARLTFRYFGQLSDPALERDLPRYLQDLPTTPPEQLPARLKVPLEEFAPDDYTYRPSQVEAHTVVRRHPLDCWEELVVRGMRFGHPVHLSGGHRLELLNAKAVITHPEPEPADQLAQFGFDLDRFHEYQRRILDPKLPEGIAYTYGNRLRGYFPQRGAGTDALESVVRRLRDAPESRRAYLSLWDTADDLPPGGDGAVPCLVTVFFRASEGRLTLNATFRSHNLLTAWLENAYGLMAVQRHVCDRIGVPPGPVTVLSHSLGIDPNSPRYELARSIAENWTRDEDLDRATGRHSLREDPNGYFVVTADREAGEVVAEHRYGGLLVKRYAAGRAAVVERQIIGDMAVSLVSHAMWLGRELAAKEQQLRGPREARRE